MMNLATHVGENIPNLKEGGCGLRLLLVPAGGTTPEKLLALNQLLKEITIDFSISGDLDHSHTTTEQILQHHPKTVQLQVLQEDFPQLWQQALANKNTFSQHRDSKHLITGLVVACEETIKKIIGQTLGICVAQSWRLQLLPGTVSFVHYPDSHHPPILQGMNVSKHI